jgi:hypothetical protein
MKCIFSSTPTRNEPRWTLLLVALASVLLYLTYEH